MSKPRGIVALGIVALLVTAVGCGGGGGTKALTITENNATQVAADVIGNTNFVDGLGILILDYLELAFEVGSGTFPCDDGDLTIDYNDVAPAGPSAGDSVVLTFGQCMLDLGDGPTTTSGGLTVVVQGFQDSPLSLQVTITYNNLTLVDATGTMRVHGSHMLDYSSPDDITFTTIISGSEISGSITDNTGTESAWIRNFSFTITENTGTGAFAVSMNGTSYSSDAGGQVDFATPTTFTGVGDNPPDAGVLVVTGANGSKLTLTALGGDALRIEVDLDGDGATDVTINTTWTALDA
jgi:hypothetical protein